jgi:predicted type IV restriction endonuclease
VLGVKPPPIAEEVFGVPFACLGDEQNEASSRILIDKALEFSGWDLLDSKQVVFESHTGTGRAD